MWLSHGGGEDGTAATVAVEEMWWGYASIGEGWGASAAMEIKMVMGGDGWWVLVDDACGDDGDVGVDGGGRRQASATMEMKMVMGGDGCWVWVDDACGDDGDVGVGGDGRQQVAG
nr:hypothetical protein [Tanacetum cinerariifolium]